MSKLTLQQLETGIDAVISNASSLIEEAKLLLKFGFHARAYTLSHIAREELAKVTMLYATGLRILGNHPVNWSKLHKRLHDHKSKLASDAITSYASMAGLDHTLSIEKMTGGVGTRNEWKNESLYVAFKEQSFKAPSEMITPAKAERTIALARYSLEDAKQLLSRQGKLTQRNPEEAKELFRFINPDELKGNDAAALIKEIGKLIHSANQKQAATKSSNIKTS